MLVNLNELLKRAQKEKYAVGLFNTTDTDMLQAVLEAAEELSSPVIFGTAEVLLPYGELSLIAPSLVEAARRAKVPVAVHYDHGLTYVRCVEALRRGFSSVMFDGSVKPYEENIAQTREIVKLAHAMGATVEGEIGHVGDASADEGEQYTTAEEAQSYAAATGVDALAVAIGSAHGVYKKKPELNIARLEEIRKNTDVPLVLHGGSGLSDEDFAAAIKAGISKVNVFTDLCLAGERAMKEGLEKNLGYLKTRNLKVNAIKEAVKTKIRLFGSAGKA